MNIDAQYALWEEETTPNYSNVTKTRKSLKNRSYSVEKSNRRYDARCQLCKPPPPFCLSILPIALLKALWNDEEMCELLVRCPLAYLLHGKRFCEQRDNNERVEGSSAQQQQQQGQQKSGKPFIL